MQSRRNIKLDQQQVSQGFSLGWYFGDGFSRNRRKVTDSAATEQ